MTKTKFDIARQHAGGVGDGFAAPKLGVAVGQHDDAAAELRHADLERHAGASRRLLKDHGQGLATVAATSVVGVLVIDCTLIGASPPTATLPTKILRQGRRRISR